MKIHGLKVALFLFVLSLVPIAMALTPDEETTYYENRLLAEVPEFSINGAMDRSFYEDFETYLSDHFFLRDYFLDVHVDKDMVMGVPVINDVVVTDQVLLPNHTVYLDNYNIYLMWDTMANLKEFQTYCAEQEVDFLYVAIPEQSTAFQEYYPSYLPTNGYRNSTLQEDFLSELSRLGIDYLDCSTFLSEDYGKYYSKTDHHYNYFGAYETYLHIADYIDTNYVSIPIYDDLEFYSVDSSFLGSRNRKLFGNFPNEDSNYYYIPTVPFTRQDGGSDVEPMLFDESQKELYNYYMGGDWGRVVLDTNRPELPTVLVLGDSFTNPLETLIYQSFDETHIVDMRYTGQFNLAYYMLEVQTDVVIFVRDDMSYLITEDNGELLKHQ